MNRYFFKLISMVWFQISKQFFTICLDSFASRYLIFYIIHIFVIKLHLFHTKFIKEYDKTQHSYKSLTELSTANICLIQNIHIIVERTVRCFSDLKYLLHECCAKVFSRTPLWCAIHFRNIVVELSLLFITHCSEVRSKEFKMAVEIAKVEFHPAPPIYISLRNG